MSVYRGDITNLVKRLSLREVKIDDMSKKVDQTFDASTLDTMLANSTLSKRLDSGIHRIDSLTDEVD
jgi:hypothetical protein